MADEMHHQHCRQAKGQETRMKARPATNRVRAVPGSSRGFAVVEGGGDAQTGGHYSAHRHDGGFVAVAGEEETRSEGNAYRDSKDYCIAMVSLVPVAREPSPFLQQPVGQVTRSGGGCAHRNREDQRPGPIRHRLQGEEPVLVHAGGAGENCRQVQHHQQGHQQQPPKPGRGSQSARAAHCLSHSIILCVKKLKGGSGLRMPPLGEADQRPTPAGKGFGARRGPSPAALAALRPKVSAGRYM